MPSSNRYPKPNPVRPGGSRPQTYPRRTRPPYRPTRPFSPPVRKPAVFPGMPRPVGPFGKRLPLPGYIPPVVPRIAYPWLRVFSRLNPWLFAAVTLYELWQLYKQWDTPAGANICRPATPGFPKYMRYLRYGFCTQGFVITDPVIASTNWQPLKPYLSEVEPMNVPNNRKMRTLWWKYIPPEEPHPEMPPEGLPLPEVVPILPPVPLVPQIPWFPISVPPLSPVPPPIHRPPFVPPMPNPETNAPPVGNYPPGHEPAPRSRVRPQQRLRPRPPGRRVKERKLKGTAQQRKFLGWLLSSASEANDLLDALHDALPKEFQGRDHPASKWEALYKNWDKVDMSEAFTNIWNNQATDKYYGEAFKKLQDGLSEAGFDFPSPRDIGGQFGLSGLR